MKHQITVDYTAPTKIPNAAQLAEHVRQRIQEHLDSVDEYFMREFNLHVDIHTLEYSGKVCINITGAIDKKHVEAVIVRVRKPPKIHGWNRYRRIEKRIEWRRRNGLAIFLAWMFVETIQGLARCVFPSRVARAVGRPLFSGRVLRSLDQCLVDIRGQLDEIAGRSATSGSTRHWMAAPVAVLSAVAGILAAGIYYYKGDPSQDPTRNVIGILATAGGFAGFIYGGTLLTLSRQYYESERAGRQLLKRLGLKSVAAAHRIGFGMSVVALAALIFGTWALTAG